MKFYKSFLAVIALLVFLSVNTFGQERKEMTEEEWKAEMDKLTIKKTELTKEIADLKVEVSNLKTKLAGLQTYDDCMKELYTMVGSSKEGIDAFRKQLEAVEAKINRREAPKADRQAELDALKANRISALPEFFDKVHNQLQRSLDEWQEAPKEVEYNVVKGDCLWFIAKKKDFYGNGFAWPKIYQANRDQIKNPNLIFPKQIFKIPNLTDDEKAHYDKLRKNYKPAPLPTEGATK